MKFQSKDLPSLHRRRQVTDSGRERWLKSKGTRQRPTTAPLPSQSNLPSQHWHRTERGDYEVLIPAPQISQRKKRTVVRDQGYEGNPVTRPVIAPPPSSSHSPSQDRLRKRIDRPDYSIPSPSRKKRKEDDSTVIQPLTGSSIDYPIDVDELFVSAKILWMCKYLFLITSQGETLITLDMEIVPSVRSSVPFNVSSLISWMIFLCRSTRAGK